VFDEAVALVVLFEKEKGFLLLGLSKLMVFLLVSSNGHKFATSDVFRCLVEMRIDEHVTIKMVRGIDKANVTVILPRQELSAGVSTFRLENQHPKRARRKDPAPILMVLVGSPWRRLPPKQREQ